MSWKLKAQGESSPIVSDDEAFFTLDRTVYRLSKLAQDILETSLGPYFVQICAERGITRKVADGYQAYTKLIHSTPMVNPLGYRNSQQFGFPMLSVFRVEGEAEEATRARVGRTISNLILEFSLPEPVDYREKVALAPFLSRAARELSAKLPLGLLSDGYAWDGDEDLTDDEGKGAVEVGKFLFADLISDATASNDKQAYFPSLRMELRVIESGEWSLEGLGPFDGIDLRVDKETEGQATFIGLVRGKVDT